MEVLCGDGWWGERDDELGGAGGGDCGVGTVAAGGGWVEWGGGGVCVHAVASAKGSTSAVQQTPCFHFFVTTRVRVCPRLREEALGDSDLVMRPDSFPS
jgi:hypothetical protein